MYKILLSGATGFVGSHLIKYLDKLGYETDVISSNEMNNEDFKSLDRDIDVVVHCGWIREKNLHSMKHYEMAELSCHFFNECKKRGIRVINLGSSSEYGVKYKPMKEDMRCEPINTYGIAKLMVTLHAKGLGFNTLRLFTVTGKGGKSFLDICERSNKWSDRKQVRDYVSVDRVCLAVQRLFHAEHLYGQVINVSSDGAQKTNKSVGFTYGDSADDVEGYWFDKRWDKYPQRQYEPSCWQADITKMEKLLNL